METNNPMKIILILLDGIGDRSYRDLDNRTPLQAASTPNLDRIASTGSNGLFHASSPGQCLPSEMAHFLLFGYDQEDFPGRGLLEAAGKGMEFRDDDVLAMAHLTGINWEEGYIPVLIHGRKDISGTAEELRPFYDAVSGFEDNGISFYLEQTSRNDGILIIRGSASPFITDSDPMVNGRPIASVQIEPNNPETEKAERTAVALNRYLNYCYQTLSALELNGLRMEKGLHPANFLATLRCGRRIHQEPFIERWGLKGKVIASQPVYGGLAHELGMSFCQVEDSNEFGLDLRERISIALEDEKHNFFHVHTKVPDEAAHKGSPEDKRDAISDLDQGFDEIVELLEKRDDILLVVTGDHSTPTESILIHSGEPSPIIMAGPKIRRDNVNGFDEISAAGGCLGLMRGRELMYMMLNYSERSSLYGHRLGGAARPYFPSDYRMFEKTV